VKLLQKAFVRKSRLGSIYRTAKGSISFTEIRKASRKSRSSIQHHRIYIATWTQNRTNIYQLGRRATVIEKQERANESNVNKTDENELCDDNTPMILMPFKQTYVQSLVNLDEMANYVVGVQVIHTGLPQDTWIEFSKE
jgi:hypothetical protein